jgi:hypothetical protein
LQDLTSGQNRRVTPASKREMRRRSAIEPVIGHLKAERRLGGNYLAHQDGDAINARAGRRRLQLLAPHRLVQAVLVAAARLAEQQAESICRLSPPIVHGRLTRMSLDKILNQHLILSCRGICTLSSSGPCLSLT